MITDVLDISTGEKTETLHIKHRKRREGEKGGRSQIDLKL